MGIVMAIQFGKLSDMWGQAEEWFVKRQNSEQFPNELGSNLLSSRSQEGSAEAQDSLKLLDLWVTLIWIPCPVEFAQIQFH